ncbi:trappc2 [Symbiodinium sp. CCMP2592]|nr:trappc2 [Symbiodinium sp. CCMP2592]
MYKDGSLQLPHWHDCTALFRGGVVLAQQCVVLWPAVVDDSASMTQQVAAVVNVLIIVGKDDIPIYEADLSTEGIREDSPHLDQFVVHAALDLVDEMVWSTSSMFLRVVDKFNDFHVSAYCTAGHVRMMLLHKHRNEEAIRAFFAEVHDLFIKAMLSPFQTPSTPIESPTFDAKVRAAGQRHFRA